MHRVLGLLLLLMSAMGLEAGERLSALSKEDDFDDYYVVLRRVFHRIYDDDVVLSAICAIGTGTEEHATGILRKGDRYEAFSAFPSASVWSTEYDRFMGGVKETCYDATTNKEIPCPPRKREKGLPISYRGIKTEMKAQALATGLAMRIKAVWQLKVEKALQRPVLNDWERGALGGLVHYYFVRSRGGGWVAAIGSSHGEHRSDAERIADLTIALQGYAVRGVSEYELEKALIAVEGKRPNRAMQRTAR